MAVLSASAPRSHWKYEISCGIEDGVRKQEE